MMKQDDGKYQDMLMQLAEERPELRDDIMDLHDKMMAEGDDIASDAMSESREPDDTMDEEDEAENNPSLAPRPDKGRIPPELQDEEDMEMLPKRRPHGMK